MRLRWTTPALRDLEAIGDFIARDNPAAAARIVNLILDQAEGLKHHPFIGRLGRVPETREWVLGEAPFLLPYRVRDEVIEILAVLHSSRRWPDHFD